METATIIAPLGHMAGPKAIDLGADLTIERTPPRVAEEIKKAKDKLVTRHPVDFTHCLIQRKTRAKDAKTARSLVQNVITLMRLYRPGGVFFNLVYHDRSGCLASRVHTSGPIRYGQAAVFFYMNWAREGALSRWKVTEADAEPLGNLIKAYRGSSLLRTPPFEFFFRAYHEPYAGDHFLKNVVGLEAALVNDEHDRSNVGFKFVERGCTLLHLVEPHPDGPQGYVPQLHTLYKERCNMVHARKKRRNWESDKAQALIRDSEDYLRKILLLILKKPTLATAAGIDEYRRGKFAEAVAV